MGLFFSVLWKQLFSEEEVKICVVGLDNAGKTTILYKLHLGEVVATQPTIGSNVEEVSHKNLKLQVWDLGGQEQLRATWSSYFVGSKALIMVIDSTDRERIAISREELFRCLSLESMSNSVVLIFANKQDARHTMSPAEISAQLDLVSIKKQSWHIQGCCALTGEGLFEGLDWLVEQIKKR